MKLILVRPRGFCAGVNRAVQMLARTCAEVGSAPIYVLHEIVHNYWVVEDFKRRGVRFVESLDEVPGGATVLFSAHGVSPKIRDAAARRGLAAIDATCPLVASLHRQARRFADQGWHIFLIGHKGHQEVIGTLGEAPRQMTLVSSTEDARTLTLPDSADPARLTYLTQTTLSEEGWRAIVAELRKRFPALTDPPGAGVCFATRNRQEAVRRVAPEADALLVVGSANSSNSRRLAELGEKSGTRSFLINGPDDIDPARFTPEMTLLMTAGASAPEEVFQLCVEKLTRFFSVEIEERVICEENAEFRC
ncbi:MAG: 4-hydroxy-3-methylbut-2-enyl diphosphate reductase [Thermoguttaceae bacterium]|nr:4-hydroxy-3-methylbut-2-enyl diphosphate reductase [Thermoguttaceae bacterium]